MTRGNKTATIPDAIPSNYSDDFISGKFTALLETELMRTKIKNVMIEYIDSVPFSKKVREYAGEEINTRIYSSVGFWLKTVLIPLAVTIITILIAKQLQIK